jgi:hypothetical protein
MHPMAQTTIRLPAPLAQALSRRARELRVPKSRLVREALERFLSETGTPDPGLIRERTALYLGALRLKSPGSDPTARLIREHNWRP